MLDYLYNKFGKDKVMHFIACLLIAVVVGVVMIPCATLFGIVFASFMCASSAALAKEYADKLNPNNRWDWNDIIADYAGTFTGIIIVILLYFIV